MKDDPMDALLEKARELTDPTWDEVREARVLQQTLAALESDGDKESVPLEEELATGPSRSRTPNDSRTPNAFLWAGCGAVAVAAVVFLAIKMGSPAPSDVHPTATQDSPSAVEGSKPHDPSTIVFEEGTFAALTPGAEVQTVEQDETRIRLRQSSGAVTYEVNPERKRNFVVEAGHIQVEVIGTRFDIEVGNDSVRVGVERGLVQVKDADRVIELRAGEDFHSKKQESAPTDDKPQQSTKPADSKTEVTRLLKEADQHRRSQNWSAAAAVLAKVAHKHSRDPRSVGALFTLGRVHQSSGQFAQAAKAFALVQRRAPGGALAEDALAEEAVCLSRSGQSAAAQQKARLYLRRYPSGPHENRLQKLTR